MVTEAKTSTGLSSEWSRAGPGSTKSNIVPGIFSIGPPWLIAETQPERNAPADQGGGLTSSKRWTAWTG